MEDLVFILHVGSTLFLVGLIWTVQVVHYPLFSNVGAEGYAEYQRLHMSRIAFVVAPAMLLELGTAIYFVFFAYEPVDPKMFWLGLLLVVGIWVSTALIQSPIHAKLAKGLDIGLVNKLVLTNWVRTMLWTARGGLVLSMVWLKIRSHTG